MKNELVIVGNGGFAKEIAWLINDINHDLTQGAEKWKITGFISSNSSKSIGNIPVLGDDAWAMKNLNRDIRFIIAIGDSVIREKIAKEWTENGFKAPIIIHPRAIIGQNIAISPGSIICAGTILTTNIKIGEHVIINLNSTIGHDVEIGSYTNISPGVNISGNVKIGNGCQLGSGSVVLPGITLTEKVMLGAGAVATKNLEKTGTYIGIPAREMLGKKS